MVRCSSRSEAAKKAWITRHARAGASSGPAKIASARKSAADFFSRRVTMKDVHIADVYLGRVAPRKSDPFEVWLAANRKKKLV